MEVRGDEARRARTIRRPRRIAGVPPAWSAQKVDFPKRPQNGKRRGGDCVRDPAGGTPALRMRSPFTRGGRDARAPGRPLHRWQLVPLPPRKIDQLVGLVIAQEFLLGRIPFQRAADPAGDVH
jgi:hypothetical protein